jgi:hypothetical protein
MPMRPDETEDTRPRSAAARAAAARAADARRRAIAAREAADQATTEYARRAHRRVADLHAQIAWSHEHAARTLHSNGEHADGA